MKGDDKDKQQYKQKKSDWDWGGYFQILGSESKAQLNPSTGPLGGFRWSVCVFVCEYVEVVCE